MTLILVSFGAGVLTIAAPCILPLLPIIVGGSIVRGKDLPQSKWRRPLTIAGSLGVSVIIFTLLLRASAALLGVPAMFWQSLSGIIVLLLGVTLLAPGIWEKTFGNKLNLGSNKLLGKALQTSSTRGDILIGAALGPVFNSCSPTYLFIVAAVLPVSLAVGFFYLLAYAAGLALALLIVAMLGQTTATKLGWLADPKGWFKKIVGALFIVVGIGVIFGLDKKLQTYILDKGWYAPISGLEERLR